LNLERQQSNTGRKVTQYCLKNEVITQCFDKVTQNRRTRNC